MSASAKGFSMKSTAPFFSAETAIGTSPWPVMKTTGRPQRRRSSSSNSSSPLIPGMRTSSTMQPVISGLHTARKASAESCADTA